MNHKNLNRIISSEYIYFCYGYAFYISNVNKNAIDDEIFSFFDFCFRNYALRRVRDAFKENKGLSEQNAIQEQINYGKENVDIIKRQVNLMSMPCNAWSFNKLRL